MTIETDIITTLNAHVGLSALVSSRNYAVNLPQNPTYPNTANSRISSNPSNSLTARNPLMNIRQQIDVRAKTLHATREAAIQVIDAMEAATLFTAIILTDNDLPKESSTDTYRISIDFSIWYTES